MMINDIDTPSWMRAIRAAKALALAATVETAITVGHFIYSARLYDDPERLHVVEPALTALAVWHPNRLLSGALSAVTGVMYVALFGLFHGAYNHLLKDIVFFAGAPD